VESAADAVDTGRLNIARISTETGDEFVELEEGGRTTRSKKAAPRKKAASKVAVKSKAAAKPAAEAAPAEEAPAESEPAAGDDKGEA